MSDFFKEFCNRLCSGLSMELPGETAQWRMAPLNRKAQPQKDELSLTRQSAVMLLLYPHLGQPRFVLIERGIYDGAHAGQISLPGGKHEEGDLDLLHTAVRETSEELGLHPDTFTTVGKLTPLYIPVSRFFVHPFVAIASEELEFSPDPREVASIIFANPFHLSASDFKTEAEIFLPNQIRRKVPAYVLEQKIVWGATAMILSEFSELVVTAYPEGN